MSHHDSRYRITPPNLKGIPKIRNIMKLSPPKIYILILFLLTPLCYASSVEMELSMEIWDNETKILRPGEHSINLTLYNGEEVPIQDGDLEVSLGLLHHGEIWNRSMDIPIIEKGKEFKTNISMYMDASGLYTVSAAFKSTNFSTPASLDVPVSLTTDRWQEWRTKAKIENKSHHFLAFYYPWYGNPEYGTGWFHWDPNNEYSSTHVPLIGFYDSRSERVMEYQIGLAQSVGLDGFISSWWGPGTFTDKAFEKLLPVAEERGFNVTVYFEIASDLQNLIDQLRYILTNYGHHPAFMKVDGKPVIFIYGRVMGQFEIGEFREAFSKLEDEGLYGFYMADRLDVKYLEVFDGLHTYSPLRTMDKYGEVNKGCQELNKTFAATLAPGYDDTIIRTPGLVVDRDNGTYYRDAWEIIMLTDPEWVLVTSWNEWHEGSEIEPSLEFGDKYLNLTSRYYRLFEAGRLTQRLEDRMEEIQKMFSHASNLIAHARDEGMDTRIMERDYHIAERAWDRFDYAVTKMYLQRIIDRETQVTDMPSLGLAALFVVCILVEFYTAPMDLR